MRLAAAVSASATANCTATDCSSSVFCGATAETNGASLTSVTVSSNVVDAVSTPSLTLTVIVDVPLASGCGETTRVRFAPDPPKVNAAPVFATTAVFEDAAASVRLAAGVCASPTVRKMAAVGVSSVVVRFAMPLMVGAVLAETACRQLATVFRALLIDNALLCCPAVPVGSPLYSTDEFEK